MHQLALDVLLDCSEIENLIRGDYQGPFSLGTDLSQFILHVPASESFSFPGSIQYSGQEIQVEVLKDLRKWD